MIHYTTYTMKSQIQILYVEDEPSIAQLLASGLGLFGMKVYPIYMNAEDVLRSLETPEFKAANILVFDIRLPQMTGIQLAKELRIRGETRPLVLVSAWPPPPRQELERLNAKFLPKPFDFPDLVQTIQSLTLNSEL